MPAAGAQLRLRAIAASAAFSLARLSVVSASTSFVGRGRPLADLPGPLSRVAGKGRETAAMRSWLATVCSWTAAVDRWKAVRVQKAQLSQSEAVKLTPRIGQRGKKLCWRLRQ